MTRVLKILDWVILTVAAFVITYIAAFTQVDFWAGVLVAYLTLAYFLIRNPEASEALWGPSSPEEVCGVRKDTCVLPKGHSGPHRWA